MFFERFSETVFTKNGNDLKRKFEILEELKKEFPNNPKLNDEYCMVKSGLKGEDEIAYELRDTDIGIYVLRDITIKIGDSKAQIDYIIITPAYVYLVECKNLLGDITVDSKGEFTREYFWNNQKIRKSMYSPVRQAEKHKEILKKIWENEHNHILLNLLNSTFKDCYKILVVMAKAEGKLNIKYAPKEIQNIVIRSDRLVDYLKKDIKTSKRFDKKQMKNFSDKFLMLNYENKVDYRKEYIEKFELNKETVTKEAKKNFDDTINKKEELRQKLIEYRVTKAKERKIPAYYIFTNKELDNILTYMPKSIDDLRETGILARVKIDLHGKEILKILSS